jgi:hypothetical protein
VISVELDALETLPVEQPAVVDRCLPGTCTKIFTEQGGL